MITYLYVASIVGWMLAMIVILVKILPIAGRWEFAKLLPRVALGALCVFSVAAINRHLHTFDTKIEELAFAALLMGVFWWIVWFHRYKLKQIDSYF